MHLKTKIFYIIGKVRATCVPYLKNCVGGVFIPLHLCTFAAYLQPNEKRPAPKGEGVQRENQEGHRTIGKNRPGSRARKRMREAAEAARRAALNS